MLAKERQMWIMQKVLCEGRVYINAFASEFGVTSETIRGIFGRSSGTSESSRRTAAQCLNQDLEKD